MINRIQLIRSFSHAIRGLILAVRQERNLQVQLFAAVLVIGLAFFLKINLVNFCLLIFSISLVLLVELINSAFERSIDVLKPRIHNYAREIKDIMAAASLLAALNAIIIGCAVFLPLLYELLKTK